MIARPSSTTLFPTRRSSDLSEPLPMRALLERGEHRGADRVDAAAQTEARQQPPARRDHRQVHLGAIAGLQHAAQFAQRSEKHTSELQSLAYLVCRLLLEKKK